MSGVGPAKPATIVVMLYLDAADCRDACAQERNFLALFRYTSTVMVFMTY